MFRTDSAVLSFPGTLFLNALPMKTGMNLRPVVALRIAAWGDRQGRQEGKHFRHEHSTLSKTQLTAAHNTATPSTQLTYAYSLE